MKNTTILLIKTFNYKQIPNSHYFIKRNLQAGIPVLSISFIISKNGDGVIKILDTKGYIDNIISWIKGIKIPLNFSESSNFNYGDFTESKKPLLYCDRNTENVVDLNNDKLHLVLDTKSRFGHTGLHYNASYDILDMFNQLIHLGAPILAATLLYTTIPRIHNYIRVFIATPEATDYHNEEENSQSNQDNQENSQSTQNEQMDENSRRVIEDATANITQLYNSLLSRIERLPGEWQAYWNTVATNNDGGIRLEIQPGIGNIEITVDNDAPELSVQIANSLSNITDSMTHNLVDIARDYTIMMFNALIIQEHGGTYTPILQEHGGTYTSYEAHLRALIEPVLAQTSDMYNSSHFDETIDIFTNILTSNMDTYIQNLINGRAWDAGFPLQSEMGGVGSPQQTRSGNRVKKRVRFNLDPVIGSSSSSKKSKKG